MENEHGLTPEEEKEIMEMLQRASNAPSNNLAPKSTKFSPKNNIQRGQLSEAIINRMDEFLNCFLMIGFDTNGSPTIIIDADNDMEARALSDLLQEFVQKTMFKLNTLVSDDIPDELEEEGDEDDEDEEF